MSKFKRIPGLIALTLLLPACAAEQAKEPKSLDQILADKGYRLGEEIQYIREFGFNGWTEVDNLHLILHSRVSDRYLVTLGSICDGLLYSPTINLSTTVGQFTRFDYVMVGGPGGTGGRCNVRALNELEKIEPEKGSD
jgi:hypothetical protein